MRIEDIHVGLEWEVQLALLEYPNRIIDVEETDKIRPSLFEGDEGQIVIEVPKEAFWNIYRRRTGEFVDLSNLEYRTRPVPLRYLFEEIERIEEHNLIPLIQYLAENLHVSIGVFLPASYGTADDTPGKHVNFSLSDIQSNPFRSALHLKGSKVKRRVHVTVPYNFTAYEELAIVTRKHTKKYPSFAISTWVNKWATAHPMKKPILVGYTRTGKYWVPGEGLL